MGVNVEKVMNTSHLDNVITAYGDAEAFHFKRIVKDIAEVSVKIGRTFFMGHALLVVGHMGAVKIFIGRIQ